MSRFLQFSLRSVIVVTTMIGLTLGWHMAKVEKYKKATRKLDEFDIYYDKENRNAWYIDNLGIDSPTRIMSVSINRSEISSDDLRVAMSLVGRLGTLTSVRIDGIEKMSQADFSMIAELTTIRSIEVEGGTYSAETINPIGTMPKLTEFWVNGEFGHFDDDILRLLTAIPTLKAIGLPNGPSGVSDDILGSRTDIVYHQTDCPP